MTPLLAAAAEVQQFLRSRGEPRFTRDVDLTLLCELGSEQRAVDAVLDGFRPRTREAREFALRNRVVLVESSSGFPIDAGLSTCSAEDLIVLKAFAGRLQAWADIEKVLVRQRAALDWKLVRDELEPLLALREAPEHLDQLEQLRSRIK
jgi:hypothetical protein